MISQTNFDDFTPYMADWEYYDQLVKFGNLERTHEVHFDQYALILQDKKRGCQYVHMVDTINKLRPKLEMYQQLYRMLRSLNSMGDRLDRLQERNEKAKESSKKN